VAVTIAAELPDQFQHLFGRAPKEQVARLTHHPSLPFQRSAWWLAPLTQRRESSVVSHKRLPHPTSLLSFCSVVSFRSSCTLHRTPGRSRVKLASAPSTRRLGDILRGSLWALAHHLQY
jgi:hypothetical protein